MLPFFSVSFEQKMNFNGIFEGKSRSISTKQTHYGVNANEKSIIQARIKERMYNSISQAIFTLVNTPYFVLKLFLFCFILFAVSVSSFLVIKSFMSYFAYDVITKTRTIAEMPSNFPKITFCNNNPFQTKFTLEYLRDLAQKNNIDISAFFDKNKTSSNFSSKLNASDFLYELAIINMNSLDQTTQKKFSHDISDLLIGCKFNNDDCSVQNFSWTFHRYRGNFFER